MNKKDSSGNKAIIIIIIFFLVAPHLISLIGSGVENIVNNVNNEKYFTILSTNANEFYDQQLYDFAKKEKINLVIEHHDDLEIVDILNSGNGKYDAVWMANSIWLYMLNNSYLVTNSKSIAISPIVMAIKKDKAQELDLINKDVYNHDLLNLIKEGKLKYVMNSVTKTNTGATAYLALLNSLAGSPEVLREEMLENQKLKNDLKEFFKGVERVSGDENYLEKMFLNGDYEAVIDNESSLIALNKKLLTKNQQPLYLLYPLDGVAINDFPFGYVNRDQKKEEDFLKIQKFLRGDTTSSELKNNGFRTWFGGVTNNVDNNVFNKDWGIDTTKYLMPLKYPSKVIIDRALELYIEELRKPTHTIFVLDVSGSMSSNNGLVELKESMNFILDREQAKQEMIQFSDQDKITIITFNSKTKDISETYSGSNTLALRSFTNQLIGSGGTNIYDPSIKALEILKNESNEYIKTIILMTDGESNTGSYTSLENYYKSNNLDIPIYSITFGSSSEFQLSQIASLTNAKIFDGKTGMITAFKEVRSYN